MKKNKTKPKKCNENNFIGNFLSVPVPVNALTLIVYVTISSSSSAWALFQYHYHNDTCVSTCYSNKTLKPEILYHFFSVSKEAWLVKSLRRNFQVLQLFIDASIHLSFVIHAFQISI